MPDIQNIPTTQYIGPRIIPHLWDPIAWSASEQYDALAVVQYNGVPYVSRYVPPQGTLPTNTEYWVRWADFNAQMAQLQDTVEGFDDRITAETLAREEADRGLGVAIQGSITAAVEAVDAETLAREEADRQQAAAIEAINTELDDKASEADVEACVHNLTDGYIVCIGDSWNAGVADGALSNYSPQNGWGRKLCSFMGMDVNSQLKNFAQPGAGFAAAGGTNQYTFSSLLDSARNSVGDDADKVTHVIMAGGINDADGLYDQSLTLTDVQNGAKHCCEVAHEYFPNARIIVFPMLWPGHSTLEAQFIRARDRIIRGAHMAEAPSCVCNHSCEWLFGRAEYFGSGTQGHHTTLDGLAEVARFMAEFINGGSAHFTYWSNQRDTSKTNALNIAAVETTIHDGVLQVKGRGTVNDSYDSSNVPLFSLPSGNTFFNGINPNNFVAAISGNQPPIMLQADGTDISLASRLGSTVEIDQQIYFNLTMPFAF